MKRHQTRPAWFGTTRAKEIAAAISAGRPLSPIVADMVRYQLEAPATGSVDLPARIASGELVEVDLGELDRRELWLLAAAGVVPTGAAAKRLVRKLT
jgi:hypothetical protein